MSTLYFYTQGEKQPFLDLIRERGGAEFIALGIECARGTGENIHDPVALSEELTERQAALAEAYDHEKELDAEIEADNAEIETLKERIDALETDANKAMADTITALEQKQLGLERENASLENKIDRLEE